MALHVVIGFSESGSQSPAEPLYCGRDADEAKRIRETYEGPKTLWLRNPTGITKTSATLAAARDAEQRAAQAARDVAAVPVAPPSLEAQLAAAERKAAKLEKQLAEVAASIPSPIVEELSLPLVPASEPVVSPTVEAAGEETAPAHEVEASEGTDEDPDSTARRQAALAAAEAAEELESDPGAKKGTKGRK